MKLRNPASLFMLFLLVFWLITQFGLAAILEVAAFMGRPISLMENIWIMSLVQLFGLLLPLFLWLIITKDSFKRNMPSRPLGAANFALTVVMGVLIIPLAMFFSAISSLFVTNDVAVMLDSLAAQPWWLMMLVFAVTPGVVEELVFRGYIQSNTRGSVTKIVVLNGFLFAMMHLSLHQFGYTFVLGVVFALMVYYTKNIWAGIIPHFIMNGVNVTISHWATGAIANGDALAEELTFAQELYNAFVDFDPALAQRAYEWAYDLNVEIFAVVVVGVIALIATAAFAGVFVAFVSHNRKRSKLFEVAPTEESTETPQEEPEPKRFRPDWCLIGVVVLYLLVIVSTMWLERLVEV